MKKYISYISEIALHLECHMSLLFDILLSIFLRKSSLAHTKKNDKLTFWQALSDLIESEKSLTNWTFPAKKASLKHEKQ